MLKGQILLWYGTILTIPDGWQMCNGENGSPDLRSRFIICGSPDYPAGETGGSYDHDHTFASIPHAHQVSANGQIAGGDGFLAETSANAATGTTDETSTLPAYHSLLYIMKLHDDPDPQFHLPWPYAAKAIIQHSYTSGILSVWITFRFAMNIDNKPADNLWIVECDGAPEAITASAWHDPWTMLLTIDPLIGAPQEVTVEYDGPDELLTTRWDKQWEPWSAIISVELPTPPEAKVFSTGPAAQDDVDVSGIGVLFLDCSGHDIIIGGFVGGVNGQVLQISRLCAAANDATLEHNEGGGEQDILLHAGGDETLTGEYGGWTLACNGTNWYDISHAKHT